MPAGQTNHITFTAPKPGEYRFYCAVPDHFDTMKGTLIVQ
jgi:plastocyanin